ncbi:MAG: hypothetical protein AABW81_03725 [Nanoarchaeota archaeon]
MEKINKKSIDELVNSLKEKYDTSTLDGLRRIAYDNNIRVIEDEKVLVPFCNRKAIFVEAKACISLKKNSYGHELGHHLLKHFDKGIVSFREEREAMYFTYKIGCKCSEFTQFLYALKNIITKPVSTMSYILFPKRYQKYIISKYYS